MNRRQQGWMALGAVVLSVGAMGMSERLSPDQPQLDLITLEPMHHVEEMVSPGGVRYFRARAETAVPIPASDYEHNLPGGEKIVPNPATHDAHPRLVTANEEKAT